MLKVAILDDYVGLALELADWESVAHLAEFTVFRGHLSEHDAAIALQPFDVLFTMRDRMSLPRLPLIEDEAETTSDDWSAKYTSTPTPLPAKH